MFILNICDQVPQTNKKYLKNMKKMRKSHITRFSNKIFAMEKFNFKLLKVWQRSIKVDQGATDFHRRPLCTQLNSCLS